MEAITLENLKSTVDRINSKIRGSNREIRLDATNRRNDIGNVTLDLHNSKTGKRIIVLDDDVSTRQAQRYLFATLEGIELKRLANKKKNLKEIV